MSDMELEAYVDRLNKLKEKDRAAYTQVLARLILRVVVYAPPSAFKQDRVENTLSLFRCTASVNYLIGVDGVYAANSNVITAIDAANSNTVAYANAVVYANAIDAAAYTVGDVAYTVVDVAYAAADSTNATKAALRRSQLVLPELIQEVGDDLDFIAQGEKPLIRPLFKNMPTVWKQQSLDFFNELNRKGLGVLTEYYQQWMGWNGHRMTPPQQTDAQVLQRWISANNTQWKNSKKALALITGEFRVSSASLEAEIESQKKEIEALKEKIDKSDDDNKKILEREKKLLQTIDEREMKLEEEAAEGAQGAHEALSKCISNTESVIKELRFQSKMLLYSGGLGVLIAFLYMLFVGICALRGELPLLVDFHDYLAIITPGLISLVAGSLLLRHDNRLRQRSQVAIQQKFQLEFGSGLLKAAAQLPRKSVLEERPIIGETFAKISDRYAAGDNQPTSTQQEKEQSMLIEKLVAAIVSAKDK